ncbi:hypothetical protein OHV05_36000 (plasmid) [Kitasatospora sp. NBC_00070]|uniref:hypothetical protein n=1 Tax=Kitasatospora sp. NBC_00070 TaxID=2975962 RepID=UPI002F915AC4
MTVTALHLCQDPVDNSGPAPATREERVLTRAAGTGSRIRAWTGALARRQSDPCHREALEAFGSAVEVLLATVTLDEPLDDETEAEMSVLLLLPSPESGNPIDLAAPERVALAAISALAQAAPVTALIDLAPDLTVLLDILDDALTLAAEGSQPHKYQQAPLFRSARQVMNSEHLE